MRGVTIRFRRKMKTCDMCWAPTEMKTVVDGILLNYCCREHKRDLEAMYGRKPLAEAGP